MIRLLLTSGRGPAECRIAVRHVLERLAGEAAEAGLEIDVAAEPAPDGHGPASALVVLRGEGARVLAQAWLGTIQWTAPSPVRPHHKRKNWFVGVIEAPAVRAAPQPLAAGEVRFEAFRAGGAGGQHQNKTESAVRAVHGPSGLSVVVREGRSQHRNKALALERLSALLADAAALAQEADRMGLHALHDRLERGRAARRFKGTRFEPA